MKKLLGAFAHIAKLKVVFEEMSACISGIGIHRIIIAGWCSSWLKGKTSASNLLLATLHKIILDGNGLGGKKESALRLLASSFLRAHSIFGRPSH